MPQKSKNTSLMYGSVKWTESNNKRYLFTENSIYFSF